MIIRTSFLILLAVSFLLGQSIYEDDPNTEIYIEEQKYANQITGALNEATFEPEGVETREARLVFDLIDHTIVFMGDMWASIGSYGVRYGFEHPQYDYIFLIKILLVLVVATSIGKFALPIVVISYLGYGIVRKKIRERNGKKTTKA